MARRGFRQGRDSESGEAAGRACVHLNGADEQSGQAAWQAAGVGAAAKTTGEDDGAALRRIKADLPTREAVRKRLKFGMTIVTTDQPADAKTRSGDGFVVLDSQS